MLTTSQKLSLPLDKVRDRDWIKRRIFRTR